MSTVFPDLPDYFTLRLAADLSSAIRAQPVWFDYGGGDTGLQITEPATSPPPPIPVLSPPSAPGRPLVQSVTVAVETQSITLPGDTCSALFWSESAVEKFLLPYYVSAGGQQAYRVLHAINQAWYAYQEITTVVALAFYYPSQPFLTGTVQLWDTVLVIYLDASGALTYASLRQFLGSQPPPQGPQPLNFAPFSWGPAIASGGTTATPIDSVGAREVAEYVSGLRERIVNVYQTDGGGGLEPTLTPIGDGPPLFTAWTRSVRPARPTPAVTLTYTTGSDTVSRQLSGIGGPPANVPDSAFWTDGAVELLLTPYYASVEGQGAPWYLALILGKWSGIVPTSVLGALELLAKILEMMGKLLVETPADVVQGVVRRLEGEAGAAAMVTSPIDSEVFAIVHLPNSEWIDQTDPSIFLENRTWLLSTGGDHPLVGPGRRLVPRRRVTA